MPIVWVCPAFCCHAPSMSPGSAFVQERAEARNGALERAWVYRWLEGGMMRRGWALVEQGVGRRRH